MARMQYERGPPHLDSAILMFAPGGGGLKCYRVFPSSMCGNEEGVGLDVLGVVASSNDLPCHA